MARRTHDRPLVQPSVCGNPDGKLLPGEGAFVAVVPDQDVQPAVEAVVLVAATSPVLPLTGLVAGALLPHGLAVVEALGTFTVALQCEVLFGLWKVVE